MTTPALNDSCLQWIFLLDTTWSSFICNFVGEFGQLMKRPRGHILMDKGTPFFSVSVG